MRDQTQPGVLPLRPLTTGEVLDAAVALLRTRTGRLVGLGCVLALTEQLVLFPLRRLADLDDRFLPATDGLAPFGAMVVVGLGTEALIIALLGGVAAAEAPRALLGPAPPVTRRPARPVTVTVVGLVAGLAAASSGWAFLVLPVPWQVAGLILAVLVTMVMWPVAYGLLGLAAPAAVIDRLPPGRAILRSITLSARNGLRVVWIRGLGYLAWLSIRFGLSLALVAVIGFVYASPSTTMDNLILGLVWLAVNTLAYPVLGCLDVALHLETRMRTEGLDIHVRRSLRRGVSVDDALAVPGRLS